MGNKDIFENYKLNNSYIDLNKSYVTINQNEIVFNVWLKPQENLVCPHCKNQIKKLHDYRIQTMYHPIKIEAKKCIIKLHIRRYVCLECKKYYFENNTLSNSNVSFEGIKFIIEQLKNTKKTFTYLSKEIFLAKSTIVNIFDECISIVQPKLPAVVSFDEVCVGNFSRESKYIFVMFDPFNYKLLGCCKTRLKGDVYEYLQNFSKFERQKVKYVTMDGWEPYRYLVHKFFPKAKICLDSFHVIETISRALDKARLMEAKKQKSMGSQNNYRLLKDNRSIFGFDWINKKWTKYYKKKTGFETLNLFLKHIEQIAPDFIKVYFLKEKYRFINKNCKADEIEKIIDYFINEFSKTTYKCFTDVVKILTNWKSEIINSFLYINGIRLSTAKIENFNVKIKLLNSNGCGYSNFERFIKRLLLQYGEVEIDIKRYK